MSKAAPPLHVLTGAPGAGKTTLLKALAQAGFAAAAEAGRAVIGEQQAMSGRALPSGDPLAFAQAMLARDVTACEAHRAATAPVFFDRGIPDVVGYLRLEGLAVPDDVPSAARARRYARVFICPRWPEIHVPDAERKQTQAVAMRTYEAMVETCSGFGYALTEMPRASVPQRLQVILRALGA